DHAASLFLIDVADHAGRLGDAVLVYDQGYWRPDTELWKSVQKADWKDVILDEDMKKTLQHEYTSFLSSEKIYKDLGVPWKRGIIFLGPPGNGKTFSLRAMMKAVGVPLLYVKTFHSYMGDEFGIRSIFQKARQQAPCLLIFEDVDSLITDNNRSFFLNEVDGLEDNDGLLMLATTNHFDKLDPALSNRPSRFDRKYTFPDPNKVERRAYAQYWKKKLVGNERVVFPDILVDRFVGKTHGFSFAYMKEAL
ncbi:hypothetical protein TREMEDRAFT_27248, partial [Tremella mesenterica DSM 1558]|uniref:uncharacterized protein n=1 Tax=Tremella mesenterica (strain ATCC 24925 / CBS 8224 / DSM 1558 / NBRC 9311 / NRRL Y-6157 / RJB 2259-6 / UBC 559-6) TaxID=578456 RepID=UPI0003F4A37D